MKLKWFLIVAILIVTVSWVESKSPLKPLKKASSAKPTKTPKSLVEEFTELPPEDVEFIKQLDKQFESYGTDIKIQVVKENSTSKNSKRTIDGELGYGFGDQHSNGFYFSKPKFMIYPYSQHDIPGTGPSAGSHQPAIVGYGSPQKQRLHTTVEIQPSQSFELKHTSTGYESYSHNGESLEHGGGGYQQQPQEHSVPVIVLRIPGPQKYAAHLQALLQQYLEIRAAQYLRAIQEQELQGHGYQQHAIEPQQYHHAPQYAQPQEYAHVQQYQQPEPQQYQIRYQPQYQIAEPQYQHQELHAHLQPFVSNYQVQHGQNVYEEHQQEVQHEVQQPAQEQQYEYRQQVQVEQHEQPEAHPHADIEYQDQYQPQIVYGPPQPPPQQHHHHSQEEESDLPSTENFPSPHHTQAIFVKSLKPKPFQPSQPDPTHAPLDYNPPQTYQHHHSAPEQQQEQQQDSYYPQEQQAEYSETAVSITPRSTGGPHNYHAHADSATKAPAAGPSKRSTPPFTEEQYRKFGKLISRLKKPKSSHKDE